MTERISADVVSALRKALTDYEGALMDHGIGGDVYRGRLERTGYELDRLLRRHAADLVAAAERDAGTPVPPSTSPGEPI